MMERPGPIGSVNQDPDQKGPGLAGQADISHDSQALAEWKPDTDRQVLSGWMETNLGGPLRARKSRGQNRAVAENMN
jgi:hypothetical protein